MGNLTPSRLRRGIQRVDQQGRPVDIPFAILMDVYGRLCPDENAPLPDQLLKLRLLVYLYEELLRQLDDPQILYTFNAYPYVSRILIRTKILLEREEERARKILEENESQTN